MCPKYDNCKRLKSCKEIDLCQLKRDLEKRKNQESSKIGANLDLVQLDDLDSSSHVA